GIAPNDGARAEAKELQAPEGACVVVLTADRLAEHVDLDLGGLGCKLCRRAEDALVREERVQEPDRDRARRAEPGAAWYVGDRDDLELASNPRRAERLACELVLHVVQALDDLGPGVADPQLVLEALGDDDVDELVDRRRNDGAAVLVREP